MLSNTNSSNFMLEYSPGITPKESADFYQLYLECIQQWSIMYGKQCPDLIRYAESLTRRGKLPVSLQYWDYPSNDRSKIELSHLNNSVFENDQNKSKTKNSQNNIVNKDNNKFEEIGNLIRKWI